jgi:hypothetical protein
VEWTNGQGRQRLDESGEEQEHGGRKGEDGQ